MTSVPNSFDVAIAGAGPAGTSAAIQLAKLPMLHTDPFDRMLVCQAIEHGLAIATPDELIEQYPVRTLW